jgi:ubiquinone/menaquinone biosynthesis C-methylase UbiE
MPRPPFRPRPRKPQTAHPTSWENSSEWYEKIVGNAGHYYHQKIIIPGVERLLALEPKSKVLDLGCGQGVLARILTKHQEYLGVDASPQLIKSAKGYDAKYLHQYMVADATKPIPNAEPNFTHAVAILSLQNMGKPQGAIENAGRLLKKDGKFIIVLNHPYYRIPRQSGWGVNDASDQQYRWVTSYLSSFTIPIAMHPGQKEKSSDTLSFHEPLMNYIRYLSAAGLAVVGMEEWVSDKKNEPGPHAKRENHARAEIPLFMAIVARKI